MGNLFSKRSGAEVTSIDLAAFEEECQDDPEVKDFDETLKIKTGNVMHSLARGVDSTGLTFESLKDVTTTLLELDQEVVKVILEYKVDVWADKNLLKLVTEYFDCSLAVLDFCHVLDKCMKQARDNQMIVQVAINMMPESGEPTQEQCERVLKELNSFLEAANPFSDEFHSKFHAVYSRHLEMQVKLQAKKKKLDKKLKFVRSWMKVSTIMLAACCAAVLICAVVAAVLVSPAIAAGVSTFSTLPLESMGRWFKSLWTKYENEVAMQQGLADSAYWGTYIAIKDLDNIKALVNHIQIEIDSIYRNVKFAKEREEPFALLTAVTQIKRKQDRFIEGLESLAEHVDICEKSIHRARSVVLKKLMQHPSTNSAPSPV